MNSQLASRITTAIAAVCLSTQAASAQDSPGAPTTVDVAIAKNGAPLVPVSINSSPPNSFTLESGATGSFISEGLAKQLGLTVTPSPRSPDPSHDNPSVVGVTTLQSFVIGDLDIPGVPIFVLPDEVLKATAGQAVAGVIGSNFFAKLPMLLDMGARKLTIWPPGDVMQAELVRVGMASARPVEVRVGLYGVLYEVTARIDDRADAHLTVNTGSARTTLPASVAARLGIVPTRKQKAQTPRFAPCEIGIAIAETVSFANFRLTGLVVGIEIGPSDDPELSGLGLDVLAQFRVLFDFPHSRMLIAPCARQ